MFQKLCQTIGKNVINGCAATGRMSILFMETLKRLKNADMKEVFRQMALLGADSLPIVLMTILCTGMVFSVQTAKEFVRFGAADSVGGVVAIAMARELVPVLTGVVVAGRIGAAIAAEIGTMKVTEQVDALRVMAANPVSFLVVPRFIAIVLMMPVLVVFAFFDGKLFRSPRWNRWLPILLLVGFLVLNVDYAFLLALVIAVLDMLPVLGVGTVLIPWALWAFFQRNFYLGFGLAILYLVMLILRQIIEPKLLGKSLGIHPLLTLFAGYAGWQLFGFLGMLLGPVAAMMIKNLLLPPRSTESSQNDSKML